MGDQIVNVNHCTMALATDGADALQKSTLQATTSVPDVPAFTSPSRAHLTGMPVELLDQIASNIEDHEVILLSLTCRKLHSKVRKPLLQPPLNTVIAEEFYQMAGTPAMPIRLCIKETQLWHLMWFMIGRKYGGNYGVYKFLSSKAYTAAHTRLTSPEWPMAPSFGLEAALAVVLGRVATLVRSVDLAGSRRFCLALARAGGLVGPQNLAHKLTLRAIHGNSEDSMDLLGR
ncbi:hypothetical protein IFR05_011596 [Cadophora sp. M221]|nr:hypothetical protein IFR05_011596 [Cadophora sp. M221]